MEERRELLTKLAEIETGNPSTSFLRPIRIWIPMTDMWDRKYVWK